MLRIIPLPMSPSHGMAQGMLLISQLRLPVDHSEQELRAAAAKVLHLPVSALQEVVIDQRAIDARRGVVHFSYTLRVAVANEDKVQAKAAAKHVTQAAEESYTQLQSLPAHLPKKKVVIVGTGPCGLLCGLLLARHGFNPILLERGKTAGDRARDVTGFWRRNWDFNTNSNVQFGEGGAGTFSDGKLYTQIRDREHRIPWILRELVKAGAPEEILVHARPHIGTDRLIKVVRTIREEIISLGGEVRFESQVTDVQIEDGAMRAVMLASGETITAEAFVFAVGHSSRDTFEALHQRGVPMDRKPFAIGVRIEHPQSMIDKSLFGRNAGHERLGAAPYKFAVHCPNGRVAFSFCMCPGGLVVAATSEAGQVVTNGMSSYARAESNANSGFMVEVKEDDFPGTHPLSGVQLQRELEKKAFVVGGSNYHAPAQKLGDFMRDKASTSQGSVEPSYKPGVTWTNVRQCLPGFVSETLVQAVQQIERQIPGFALDDAVMTGVETRSSSPLRIPRDPVTYECTGVRGFYPAGEGAGYAGGIISAAVDGMRVAEQLLKCGG